MLDVVYIYAATRDGRLVVRCRDMPGWATWCAVARIVGVGPRGRAELAVDALLALPRHDLVFNVLATRGGRLLASERDSVYEFDLTAARGGCDLAPIGVYPFGPATNRPELLNGVGFVTEFVDGLSPWRDREYGAACATAPTTEGVAPRSSVVRKEWCSRPIPGGGGAEDRDMAILEPEGDRYIGNYFGDPWVLLYKGRTFGLPAPVNRFETGRVVQLPGGLIANLADGKLRVFRAALFGGVDGRVELVDDSQRVDPRADSLFVLRCDVVAFVAWGTVQVAVVAAARWWRRREAVFAWVAA